MKSNLLSFATRAIHFGYEASENNGALNPPVYMTSTFCFDNVEQGAARFSGEESGYFYSRISNPTQALLEGRLADLEEAEAGLVTASGMGAITATMWTLLAVGDRVIADKTLYGCTFAYLQHGLRKFGIDVVFVDCTDAQAVESALTENTKVVYFESPVNPNMRVIDIQKVSELAHDYNPAIKVVVDNTYCTPVLQRPMLMGADLVIHSATKYLGGHGDLIAGAVLGDKDLIDRIRIEGLKDMTGAVVAPLTAFLVLRGLKTLELRMNQHCLAAHEIAMRLDQHCAIETVYYPGLKDNEFYELSNRQMDGYGGMIAFELKGGFEPAIKFMNRLKLIKRAVSLGDAETLCQHPASMTHGTYTPEERVDHGISEGLVRISIGLESIEDIYADLIQALHCY